MEADKLVKHWPELREILRRMDLPDHRKMGSSPVNLDWLRKNLTVRNANKPGFSRAVTLLSIILDGA